MVFKKPVQNISANIKEPQGNDYYYDLYRELNSGLMLCCDGEQCKVLEQTEEYVRLIDVENIDNEDLEGIDTTFRLSSDEYKITTGGSV